MKLKIPPHAQDHRRGPPGAPVTMIEYGDFQCPYCGAAFPVLERLVAEFQNDLCFIFRHFPLRNLHPDAHRAALAAEAADQQGKFWSMHRLLFENQDDLSWNGMLERADALNLDPNRFRDDMNRPDLIERIDADFTGGVRSGVNGTPTIYLNGTRFDASVSHEPLRRAIWSLIESGESARP